MKKEHLERENKPVEYFTRLKRVFVIVFLLMLIVLFFVYEATERYSFKYTVISKYFGNSTLSNISRSKLTTLANYPHIRYYYDLNKSTTSMANGDTHTIAFTTTTTTATSKEFPNMPDPCSKPRRNTGVEDVLCMKRPVLLPEYKNPCWIDSGQLKCLPYFYLIGICKSGTSDFFKRIYLHPDIVPNKGIFGKEVNYWSVKRFFIRRRGSKFKQGMTLKEFTSQFHPKIIQNNVDGNGYHSKVTGQGDPQDIWNRFYEEATPQNTPGAEELLWTTPYAVHHVNPNVKLLLMLRDPIERLYSHYFHSGAGTSAESFHNHIVYSIPLWKECLRQHTVRSCIYNNTLKKKLRFTCQSTLPHDMAINDKSMETAISVNDRIYISGFQSVTRVRFSMPKAPIYTSFYIVHLREWLKVFPREQIFIFRNEDYAPDMKRTLKSVFSHLNVSTPSEDLLKQMEALPHFYITKKKTQAGPMKPETKEMLIKLYKPYTEELAVLLGDERFSFRDRSFA